MKKQANKRPAKLPTPAVEPPLPAPTLPRRELRRQAAEDTRRALWDLFHLAERLTDELDSNRIETLETMKLIIDRDKGCSTPVEAFITSLIMMYAHYDDDGQGLTPKDIEIRIKEFRDDYETGVRDAHFIASRHAPLADKD